MLESVDFIVLLLAMSLLLQIYIGMVPDGSRTHGSLRMIMLQFADLKYQRAVNIPNVLRMRECGLSIGCIVVPALI